MTRSANQKSSQSGPGDLHPDLQGARIVTVPFHRLWLLPLWRTAMRRMKSATIPGVEIEERSDGDVHVRIYRPQGTPSGAGLLWMHGGGLIIGAPIMDDLRCSTFASELGLVVVSAHYRLAPEHPFPAAIDDCAAAWHWLQDTADELGVDPKCLVIGGESAGGGLAACLAHRLHDEGGVQPLGQLLVYPMLDDRTAARRELDDAGYRIWNNRSNRAGWSSYLGHEPGGPESQAYSVAARRKDLSGLPPAWVGVGGLDLFLEENREYVGRLQQAGVRTTFVEIPGAPHGFVPFAPDAPISRTFMAGQLEFLQELT